MHYSLESTTNDKTFIVNKKLNLSLQKKLSEKTFVDLNLKVDRSLLHSSICGIEPTIISYLQKWIIKD